MRIQYAWLGLLLLSFLSRNTGAETVDPCGGPKALFALANRPTAADSACTVPFEKEILEMGAQYQNIKGGKSGYNLPQMDLRLGLPARTELSLIVPNYYHQSALPHAGWGAATIGLKHELGYNAKWLGSIEGLMTFPSGSRAFGSRAMGGAVNGIVSYTINPVLNLTFMLGVSTQTESYSNGGQRFNSVNPDLVLAWQMNDKFQSFGEVYGQSKAGPNTGAGFNADAGLQYLVTDNFVTDVEVGQRISGQLGQFNNYVGAGLSWLY